MQQSKSRPLQTKTKATKTSGVVRIIGGSMRGRKLRFSTVDGLRPTLDRVRETLFNWLAHDISHCQCLDLFAGSGALSFEAISRGASSVLMVEKSQKVAKNLKQNCELLQIKNCKVTNLAADKFLQTNQQKFDLVFLDPPFGKDLLADTLNNLQPHLNDDALIYIEQEKSNQEFVPEPTWQQLKYKKTGSFSYALYQLKNVTDAQ